MAFLCYIPAALINRMLRSACKRNVALQSEYAVSNTSCRSCEHFLSRILHFSGTFEHFLRKGSTPCLGFCVFRALSNTSSGRGASLVSDSAFFGYFRTLPPEGKQALSRIPRFSGTFEHASREKGHALFPIPHLSCTFRQFPSPARISTLPNLFFLPAVSFSPADQQHCQHKE